MEHQLQMWNLSSGELMEEINFDDKLPSDKPVKKKGLFARLKKNKT